MISDQDIELLETHLDAQLTTAEDAALSLRLASEPQLRQQLNQLQQQRASRAAAFEAFRPTEAAVDHAIQAVNASIARRSWFSSMVQSWPRLGVAAACIAMFAAGMWMRNNLAGSGQVSGIRFSQPVSMPLNSHANGRPVIEMRVLDATGQPIDARAFGSIDDAEQFIGRLRLQRDLSTPR